MFTERFKKEESMLKKFFENLKKEKELKREKERQELIRKKYEIRGALIQFYEDLDEAQNSVNIPAFIRADKALQIHVVTEKDINFFYNKLKQYRKAA